VSITGLGVWWYQVNNKAQMEMAGAGTTFQPSDMYRSGPFHIGIENDPLTPVVGNNSLTLLVQDSESNPISGVTLNAVATMPSMGTMPAMYAPADLTETAPGVYAGTFTLSMAGAWPLTLEINKAGIGSTQITFDLATSQQGLSLATGGQRIGADNDEMAVMNGMPGMAMNGMMSELPGINLDNRRRQLIGLETEEVSVQPLVRSIKAVGDVNYDETRLADISLRFDAWIGDVYADYVGKEVRQGDILFTVYGPDLLTAQQEYLEVVKRRGSQPDSFIAAARRRLLLFGMTAEQIEALVSRGEAQDYVAVSTPLSGTVIKKNIVMGSAQKAGMTLMRIADLSRVWVEARVYESEVPLIQTGMQAEVTLPFLPGMRYQGTVDYIYPYLQGDTRTARIRLPLPNQDGQLKPGMYAEVSLEVDMGERLVVPESAVLFSGRERVVFVDRGNGQLQPRYIETGQRNEDYIEVLTGLNAGDRVVTSGNFLIDAETRLKTGIKQW
jgi:Cu(I)/Ag(I) efflux system membrane fusion protein